MIYLAEGYAHFDLGNDDISVLILANKISFSNGIMPVCIDWNSKYKTQDEAQGQVNWL